MKTAERFLLEDAQDWHDWEGDAVTAVALSTDGPYPVSYQYSDGSQGAADLAGFLGDTHVSGTETLRLLRARDAEHAVRLATLVGDLRAMIDGDHDVPPLLYEELMQRLDAESSSPALPDGTKGAGR